MFLAFREKKLWAREKCFFILSHLFFIHVFLLSKNARSRGCLVLMNSNGILSVTKLSCLINLDRFFTYTWLPNSINKINSFSEGGEVEWRNGQERRRTSFERRRNSFEREPSTIKKSKTGYLQYLPVVGHNF